MQGKNNQMKNILILIASLLITSNALATEQAGDKLIFNDNEYWVDGFLLQQKMFLHFTTYKTNAKAQGLKKLINTANWDGWSAELKIVNNKLYISSLSAGRFRNKVKNLDFEPSNDEAFGTYILKEGLYTEWFSDKLYAAFGEKDENGVPKHSIHFTIEKGRHVKTEIFSFKFVDGKWTSSLVSEQIYQ